MPDSSLPLLLQLPPRPVRILATLGAVGVLAACGADAVRSRACDAALEDALRTARQVEGLSASLRADAEAVGVAPLLDENVQLAQDVLTADWSTGLVANRPDVRYGPTEQVLASEGPLAFGVQADAHALSGALRAAALTGWVADVRDEAQRQTAAAAQVCDDHGDDSLAQRAQNLAGIWADAPRPVPRPAHATLPLTPARLRQANPFGPPEKIDMSTNPSPAPAAGPTARPAQPARPAANR